jgi:hypothetical protein
VTSGASGSGNGSVVVAAAANTGAPRNGTVTIAGQTVSISQHGTCSTYDVSPTTFSFDGAGGSGTITVAAASGCAWTAVSNETWISVVSGGAGAGDGTVLILVAENTANNRNGTLTVAGRTVAVHQTKK